LGTTDVVEGLLDRLAAREVTDGVSDLAAPVLVSVIAELVGIPEEDRTQFRDWSRLIVSGGASSRVATAQFADYVEGMAAHRRITPEDDLLSGLVALETDGAGLDRDELVADPSVVDRRTGNDCRPDLAWRPGYAHEP